MSNNSSDFEVEQKTESFPPTQEQQNVIDLAAKMEGLKVDAFAGAAKTSTMVMVAEHIFESSGKRGQYLAFNKKNAEDAGNKFGRHADSRTFHALARQGLPKAMRERTGARKNVRYPSQWRVSMGIQPLEYGKEGFLSAQDVAEYLINTALKKYCNSGDYDPGEEHFEIGDFVMPENAEETEAQFLEAMRSEHLGTLQKIWLEIINPENTFFVDFDQYAKFWAREHPQIAADYIMFDEAQDANPVIIDLLRNQKVPVIWTGDRHQQIYSWRGAVNAMSQISVPHTANLTQSFRFGERTASLAGAILAHSFGEERVLRGFEKLDTKIYTRHGMPKDTQAVLCRTNATVVAKIMELLGRNVGVVLNAKKEIETMLKSIQAVENGDRPSGNLAFLKNRDEMIAYFKAEQSGESKAFVAALEDGGSATKFLAALEKCKVEGEERIDPEKDVYVLTAHRSKGMEWDRVYLADDLVYKPRQQKGEDAVKKEQEQRAEFVRLMYVAATRARKRLYLSEGAAESLNEFSGGRLAEFVEPVAAMPLPSVRRKGLLAAIGRFFGRAGR